MNQSQYQLITGKTLAWKDILPAAKRKDEVRPIPANWEPPPRLPVVDKKLRQVCCSMCKKNRDFTNCIESLGICIDCYRKAQHDEALAKKRLARKKRKAELLNKKKLSGAFLFTKTTTTDTPKS